MSTVTVVQCTSPIAVLGDRGIVCGAQVVTGLGEGSTRGVQIPAVNLLNLLLATPEVLSTLYGGLQVCSLRSPAANTHNKHAL